MRLRRILTGFAAASISSTLFTFTFGTARAATTHPAPAAIPAHETYTRLAAAPPARRATPVIYIVKSGDTLSGVAQSDCNDAADWTGIYHASRQVIGSDPDLILPGQQLTISCWQAPAPASPVPAPVTGTRREAGGSASGPRPQSATQQDVSYRGGSFYASYLSESQIEALWVSVGGPRWAAWAAAQVAHCESGWYRYAHNPSGASGLWQILGQVVGGNVYDPYVNARNAVAKFEASGDRWSQWVCQP